ncbi:putative neurotransmitter-gated ion-channel [Helianthus annuus]|uniref:Putative neurotransmitter-gated ion-channel, conserved site n=1 Tax=Helianthus annuus TaxID=4232 RepID=A0A251S3U2_HELAN|nr:putative neurotransmitter-gated ion-channel [Helianthus annuus]KAJ0626869.1 putative neurotransmitter-gated ion-channel [Helianthus annuus]
MDNGSTCWFFDNISIPSIFFEGRRALTISIRQRQERIESKTCELFVHIFPSDRRACIRIRACFYCDGAVQNEARISLMPGG